jgi:outer membrane immunogenic protein
MKKLLFAATLSVLATSASAADLPRRAPGKILDPVAVRLFDWSGFYVGGNIGYGWGDLGGLNPKGFVGGGQVGYNYMFPGGFLIGAEADLSLSGMKQTAGALQSKVDHFGTIRGRIGYAVDSMLFYGTAGWGWGRGTISVGGIADSKTHSGWTYGVGLEAGLLPHVTARIEYLRLNLGAETYATVVGPIRSDVDTNLVRVGMNYKF